MKIRIFKRKIAFLLCAVVVSVFLLLYLYLNFQIPTAAVVDRTSLELHQFYEDRLEKNDVAKHKKIHKSTYRDQSINSETDKNRFDEILNIRRPVAKCSMQADVTPVVDINMLDLYREVTFDNPNGGAWKQGWNIELTKGKWTEDSPLKVFVVPHSHNDPGWIQTFDEYYERQTKLIFANMLRHLTENPKIKFIWAEISYFAKWYDKLGKENRDSVKQLVKNHQLEFVSGGWVMPDEANTHWYSIVEQLTEGHLYLKKHFNITPVSSWSIDPFGHSPTLAYVLKNAGFQNHLIQRTHYVVKRELAKKKELEFNWRSVWSTDDGTDLLTHMMPFYSYDVPHTCGPDPKVCCQFDFKRLPGFGLNCPWKIAPQRITDENVAAKANLIVDQWLKKAELYDTKSLLVPLGDDFRYTQSTEWESQRQNYEKLFDYISESNLNVEAKFGTLTDYFDSIRRDKNVRDFPILSGDFFTYADKDQEYWSGYFTTRPYHKRMDRFLMNYIRSAEMISSWRKWDETEYKFDEMLMEARREHSLFQHHDGITGTAKDHVVHDYEIRMESAIRNCKHVIQHSVFRLLTQESIYASDSKFVYFSLDDTVNPSGHDDNRPTIILGEDLPKKYVVLLNSLPKQRSELVEFHIAKPYVIVTDADESITYSQIAPVWTYHKGHFGGMQPQASTTKFRLMFKATVPPLGLAVYIIHAKNSADVVLGMGTTFTKTTIYTPQPFSVNLPDYPYSVEYSAPKNIVLKEVDGIAASFDNHGLLTSVVTDVVISNVSAKVNFLKYTTRKSGAYLFLPTREAQALPLGDPVVLVSRGPMESSVSVSLPFGLHQTFLRDSSIEIRNLIDIRENYDNSEIIMRIATNIDNGETFYTDLNGLNFIKRERFSKLPIQGNYYPIPTGIFIEDENVRLTVFTGQPAGGSSLESGSVEVMLDRKLNQDDERGLGQGILDNRPVLNIYRLVFESRERCRKLSSSYPGAFLTSFAQNERETLLYPMIKLVFNENEWTGILPEFGSDHKPLQTGIEVVTMKKIDRNMRGVIIHRTNLDSCESTELGGDHETVNLSKLLGGITFKKLYGTSLTFVHKLSQINVENIELCPMETKAFLFS